MSDNIITKIGDTTQFDKNDVFIKVYFDGTEVSLAIGPRKIDDNPSLLVLERGDQKYAMIDIGIYVTPCGNTLKNCFLREKMENGTLVFRIPMDHLTVFNIETQSIPFYYLLEGKGQPNVLLHYEGVKLVLYTSTPTLTT